MRIAIISDIHANVIAFKTIIKHMQSQKVDKIIFLGDLVMCGPHPKEVLSEMKQLSPLIWIKGNTDNWLNEIGSEFKPKTKSEDYLNELFKYAIKRLDPEEKIFLLSKPDKQMIEIQGLKILCVHASNSSIDEQIGIMTPIERLEQITNEIDADVLICGHAHLSYYSSYNKKLIINPGSISLSRDGDPRAAYGILDIDEGNISYTNYKISYDIQRVIEDAKTNDFPYIDIFIERLSKAK